jgi:hypothetical protein
VARIHELLDGDYYTVQHDVVLTEPDGGTHQVDVLLKPKNSYARPILLSCKSSKHPIGPDHVREWESVVQGTGAAAGVIVSPTGFTDDAVKLSKAETRRISLWKVRRLSADDFGPDERSPTGYIRGVGVTMHLKYSRPREDTFVLDVESASGRREGRTIPFTFSARTRERGYLRDEHDNLVGNLWDQYVVAAEALKQSGSARVEYAEPRFLVLDGHRLRFKSLSMEIEVLEHVVKFEIDVTRNAFAYENVVTGEVKFVPLPPSVLEFDRR